MINGYFLKSLFIWKGKISGLYITNDENQAYKFHKSVLNILTPKIQFKNRIEVISIETIKILRHDNIQKIKNNNHTH